MASCNIFCYNQLIVEGCFLKLIAFDLDDTLLLDDLSISDYSVSVLNRLHQDGHIIVPASGRAKDSMISFVKRIGCASYYISCNGAEIWDARDDSLITSEVFSVDTGKRIAAFGRDHDCYSQTYAGDSFFYSVRSKYADLYAASSMLKGVFVGDLVEFINEPRSKILMMDSVAKISSLLAEARSEFSGEASITCSKPYFLEFNPINASKGKALARLCEMTGMDMSDVIAFGDSLNDLSMLTAAGLGIAMGNAREDVKVQCADICGTNMEDGVALYLDRLFFQTEEKK